MDNLEPKSRYINGVLIHTMYEEEELGLSDKLGSKGVELVGLGLLRLRTSLINKLWLYFIVYLKMTNRHVVYKAYGFEFILYYYIKQIF